MASGIIARMRSLWRGVCRRSDVEADMNEEFRLHVELRAQDLVRSGLSLEEAVRQARREFGSTERHKEEARRSRGLHRIDALRFSWLDFRLGFRMLARYPGLTVVGGLAIAFAIWVGALGFELVTRLFFPTLPLDEGERVVAIENWDAVASRADRSAEGGRIAHDVIRAPLGI
jgi:putative ABC transport system permease protein